MTSHPTMSPTLALAERVEAGQIKALSILQPYPHHIFQSGKDVENRDWPTKGRGWFVIHAGKSKRELDDCDPPGLPLGGIVGLARIVDCVTEMDSQWFFGRYGFVLRDAFPVPLIPCRGQLGFFSLPPEINTALAGSLKARAAMEPQDA
jgi:hypothetical protein